ncbi:cytochrome c-550 PedF [Rubellimicrobium aerolatum]|uniref:Cytochrome c-550 PedF n=1 Tax=Rubellimicrobium aerolatum TaxID=490979 RepID=A0ABW0S977_9RHOB|nr:cytochrome c-550 PedF [Rubellimicrobium aerolatum]MBP1804858.1 cytochrome c-550 PedF [Rubellimicrobium aerolatum]
MTTIRARWPLAAGLIAVATLAWGHGDVAPQAVNTDALPDIGEEWLTENPYRSMEPEVFQAAIQIGDSGFNQNCARCHGLGAISGGLAPDLRFLEAEEYGDEWFAERFQHGMTQNGVTKMPAFGEILGQKAAWAIRSYIETRPDDQQVVEAAPQLTAMRDKLAGYATDAAGADVEALKAELLEINAGFETLSGAPVADSAAAHAARVIDGSPEKFHEAAQLIDIVLSVAN